MVWYQVALTFLTTSQSSVTWFLFEHLFLYRKNVKYIFGSSLTMRGMQFYVLWQVVYWASTIVMIGFFEDTNEFLRRLSPMIVILILLPFNFLACREISRRCSKKEQF